MNVMSMTNSNPLNNSNLSSMNSSQSMNFSSPLATNTNWSNNSPNLSNNFNNSVTTGFGNFGPASLPVMGLQQQVLGQQQQQRRNPVNSKPDLSAFDSFIKSSF